MNEEMQRVKSGQITYAVRDTSINGITIKVDDIMGIDDEWDQESRTGCRESHVRITRRDGR